MLLGSVLLFLGTGRVLVPGEFPSQSPSFGPAGGTGSARGSPWFRTRPVPGRGLVPGPGFLVLRAPRVPLVAGSAFLRFPVPGPWFPGFSRVPGLCRSRLLGSRFPVLGSRVFAGSRPVQVSVLRFPVPGSWFLGFAGSGSHLLGSSGSVVPRPWFWSRDPGLPGSVVVTLLGFPVPPCCFGTASGFPAVLFFGFPGFASLLFGPDPVGLGVPGGCRERPHNLFLLFSTDMDPVRDLCKKF